MSVEAIVQSTRTGILDYNRMPAHGSTLISKG